MRSIHEVADRLNLSSKNLRIARPWQIGRQAARLGSPRKGSQGVPRRGAAQAADVALITNARRALQPSTTTADHFADGSDQCGLSGARRAAGG